MLIAVMVLGALLLRPTASFQEIVGGVALGWALGQFLYWEPPK